MMHLFPTCLEASVVQITQRQFEVCILECFTMGSHGKSGIWSTSQRVARALLTRSFLAAVIFTRLLLSGRKSLWPNRAIQSP